jgi:diguanylate cyclase (GGDEF)-like protein
MTMPNKTAPHTPTIRARIALIVVACVLPMACMAAFLILFNYSRERAEVARDALNRTRATVDALDQELVSTITALKVLGGTSLLADKDLARFHARASHAVDDLQATNIVMLDRKGQMLLSTSNPYGEALPKLAQSPLLDTILRTGQPGVSNLFMSPLKNRLILTVAVPVRIDGSVAYALNAVLKPARFNTILRQQGLRDSWRAVIVDAKGTIVARSHDIERYLGKKPTANFLERIGSDKETQFESTTLDGVPVLTVFSRSRQFGWTVAVGVPLAELTAGLVETLVRLVLLTIVVLAACLGLVWHIGGSIAHSVQALLGPAKALGSGEIHTAPAFYFLEAEAFFESLMLADATLHKAKYKSHHDPLTGLANRSLFGHFLDQQLAACRQGHATLVLLYIDLDGFKAVNDRYGHDIGDKLLCMASDRINTSCRDSDVAARLGGDEFAVGLINADIDSARIFSDRLIEKLSSPYHLGELRLTAVSASIGIALHGPGLDTADALLQAADAAMYQAKALGKRRYSCAS